MESLLPIKADTEQIRETQVEVISPASDTANIPTPATVDSENNSLAPASVGNQSVGHSRHPMITRSYSRITGRRPLHTPRTPKSSTPAPSIRTPNTGTPKRNTHKKRTPMIIRTPRTPKSPRIAKTVGRQRVQAPHLSDSSTPESREPVEHVPRPVTRRRSLYNANAEGATKRKVQESPNPNSSEIVEPSPFKRSRLESTPSPRQCPNPVQTLSTSQSTVTSSQQMAEDISESSRRAEGTNNMGTDNVAWNALERPQNHETSPPEGSPVVLYCLGRVNVPLNDEEESTDLDEESVIERTVVQPTMNSIVNRFRSPANAVHATSDTSYEDSSSERTLTPTSVPSDISTSIDPVEIIERNNEPTGLEMQVRTIAKYLPGSHKNMCLLM